MSHLGLFIGRFHPLAVHLPIGILLVLAVLELSSVLSRTRLFCRLPALGDGPRTLILVCSALAAVVAAAMGWLLSRSGEYDAALVHRHRNLGLIVAGLSIVLLALHGRRWRLPYAAVLVATFVALMAAGHTGGTLTHGATFLTEYLPRRLGSWLGMKTPAGVDALPGKLPDDPRQRPAYAGLIQPLLTERCASCHGPTKTNGDLRLDTWAALIKGGKHGVVLSAADPLSSHLLQRIELPIDEKLHMPPKGKPQLTDDEATLLHWWIQAGASEGKALGELEAAPDIGAVLAAHFGLPTWGDPPPDRAATMAAATAAAEHLGIICRPLTPDGPWLAVNARIRSQQFGDADLAQLSAVAPAIQWLDLGETAVTDRGLSALKTMVHLNRLDLDRTAVDDAGLVRLAPLAQLQYLNLYGTAVSDAGLAALRALPSLRSLYLWQTKVTQTAADALAATLTDRRKLQRWQEQMADLQNKIRGETFYYNLGAPAVPVVPVKEAAPKIAKTPSVKPVQ